jgi:hypothetical protein
LSHHLQFDHDQLRVTASLSMKAYLQNDPIGNIEIKFGDPDLEFAVSFEDLKEMHREVSQDILPRFQDLLT